MSERHQIYIGWDPREELAYQVAEHSIKRRASAPVDIQPIKLATIDSRYQRPILQQDGRLWCPISNAPMATEFAISRFVVPLIQREAWAIFMDCDVLCTADIEELWERRDNRYAVQVVQRAPQVSSALIKMDGQVQTYYARKNWSSVVLWNCAHPAHQRLSWEDLNRRPGRDLHAFYWLRDEEIGALPSEWNHLVDVDPVGPFYPKLLHYTLGGPWQAGYATCGFADQWRAELKSMIETYSLQRSV